MPFFCGSCGFNLKQAKEVGTNEVVAPEPVAPEPVAPQPVAPQPVAPQPVAPQPVVAQSAVKKKKNKFPVILIVIILVGAILGAGYVFGKDMVLSLFKTPEQLLVDGFFNSMEARTGEIYTTIELEDFQVNSGDEESDKMIEDIIKDMQLETSMRFDQKERQVEGELSLRMMSTSLVEVDYYVTDEFLIVDVPLLYDEPMYWDIYSLLGMLRGGVADGSFEANLGMFDGPDLDADLPLDKELEVDFELLHENYDEYKDMLDRDTFKTYDEIDFEPYKEIMVPYYEDAIDSIEDDEYEMEVDSDVSFKGSRYEIDFNYEDYMDMTTELIEILSDDESIQAFMEEIVTMLIERIIDNEDYAFYALLAEESISDIDEWDEDFEDELDDIKDDMLDDIEDGFKDLEDSIDEAKDEANDTAGQDVEALIEDMDVSLYIDLDDNGYIRSQVFEIEGALQTGEADMADPFAMNIENVKLKTIVEYNLLDEEVDIEGIDEDDAIDVGAMNEEELSDFEEEIQNNLLESLMSNPAFSDLMMGF